MRAHQILERISKQTPSDALHKTVAFVIEKAKKETPFTTMARIDADMSATTTPRRSTRTGKKIKSGKNKNIVSVAEGGAATRIVLARLRRGSYYNRLTDHRYYLDRAKFSPGQGAAGFLKKVEQVAIRMVKARHSSIKFFLSSWNAVGQALLPHLPRSYQGYFTRAFGKTVSHGFAEIGHVTPAQPGNPLAICTIENRIGMDPRYPVINERRNKAALEMLVPALQRAIDHEFMGKINKAMQDGLLDQKSALAQFGMIVTV